MIPMIAYFGSEIVRESINKKFDNDSAFILKQIHELKQLKDTKELELFVIGPDVTNPIKLVQSIVEKDKLLSILILAAPDLVKQIKQTLQFSPFVGKNTTCIPFYDNINLNVVFNTSVLRTRQRRGFNKLNLPRASKHTQLTPVVARLKNIGHMLEHAPIGVVLVDPAGNVIGVNKRSRVMFPALQETQVPLQRLFAEQQVLEIKKMFREGNESILGFQDVHGHHFEVSAAMVTQDEETRMLLLINDVTERKEKDLRVRAILESLPQMAWTASPDGKITYYTQLWYSYTDQTAEEALGDGWAFVVHPEDLSITATRWRESVDRRKVFQHAARLKRYDGEYRWHLSKAVPVYSAKHEIIMWVGTSTDIHDQVLRTEELERKVKERTRSLEETNAELEQFTYISSHDLREPLRKIHTFAHIVKDNAWASLDEASRKYLDKIISTSTRMSNLLKDLLSFTKLRNEEPITPVNLNEVITSTLEDVELAVSQTRASIQCKQLPVIPARQLQIKQLFFNLISNAIKFRSPERDPVIQIWARKISNEEAVRHGFLDEGGEYWDFVVKDNGIGFDQKYADQIFTIFQRLHSRSSYDGTGIGLAICKRIVINHGGKIFAISSPGNGSEFHIVFPTNLAHSRER